LSITIESNAAPGLVLGACSFVPQIVPRRATARIQYSPAEYLPHRSSVNIDKIDIGLAALFLWFFLSSFIETKLAGSV
jgi:hypothetical protein